MKKNNVFNPEYIDGQMILTEFEEQLLQRAKEDPSVPWFTEAWLLGLL